MTLAFFWERLALMNALRFDVGLWNNMWANLHNTLLRLLRPLWIIMKVHKSQGSRSEISRWLVWGLRLSLSWIFGTFVRWKLTSFCLQCASKMWMYSLRRFACQSAAKSTRNCQVIRNRSLSSSWAGFLWKIGFPQKAVVCGTFLAAKWITKMRDCICLPSILRGGV